jgi:predicted permease
MADWREEVRARLAPLRLDPAHEAGIVEELAGHLEQLERDGRHRGLSPNDAEQVAREALSTEDALAAALHSVVRPSRPRPGIGAGRGEGALAALRNDVAHGLRVLRSRPGFTAAAGLTLALGTGATTAIFGVVRAVLLRPLPFVESERLVSYWGTAPEKGLPVVNLPDGLFTYHRRHTRTLSSLAAYEGPGGLTLSGAGEPERVRTAWASAGFFEVFGMRPLLGRTFRASEEQPSGGSVAVMSFELWQTRFGGDSAIVGRTILLNDQPTTVVGVMPPGFDFPDRTRLWSPQRLTGNTFNCWCFSTVGRMVPGATPDGVREEMARLTDDFALSRRDVFPNATPGGSRMVARPLATVVAGDVRTPLLVLLAAVAVVLLIGCANVANLTLARATRRSREMALRCCLGASPARIRAQLLTESVLLGILGTAGGLVLAYWSLAAVRTLPADRIPRVNEAVLDPVVFAVAAGVALLAGVLCGWVPAARSARADLQMALRDGARDTGGRAQRRASDAFVVAQLAGSLVLLVGAGLLLRSFRNLTRVDPGYRVDQVLLATLQLPGRYEQLPTVHRFFTQVEERVRGVPGVRTVGLTSRPPLTPGNSQDNVIAEGREPRPGEPVKVANIRYVSPAYFEAIGTPVLRGRAFTTAEVTSAERVAIVDQSTADRYWSGEDPIGKRIRHGDDSVWLTIIGVVPNVKHSSLDEDSSLQLYELFGQDVLRTMHLVIRSPLPSEALVPAVRAQVAALDPSLPLYDIRTMRQSLDRTLTPRRLTNLLLGGFALAALALALIGVYGVVSLGVNARLREFGVRVALGATPGDVRRLVLGQGVRLALIGIAVGAAATFLLMPALRSLLYQVPSFDPFTVGGVGVLLVGAVVLACYVPARRATSADPMEALRAE